MNRYRLEDLNQWELKCVCIMLLFTLVGLVGTLGFLIWKLFVLMLFGGV